jgi:glycosyl transferase family 25
MKFFITHYTPLIERKSNIVAQLEKHGIIEYEFIELYDREKLNKSNLDKFSQIKLSEISLFLKHIEIFNKCSDEIVIVFEDDAILVDNFMDKLTQYLDELNKYSWDVLFSGGCCDLHVNSVENKHIYESNGSRGTCMYVLNKGVCSKLKNIIEKETQIIKPIDHWFNDMGHKYNLKYYWSEPELVIQGSEIGLFKSVIR